MSKNTIAVKTHAYSYVDKHKSDVKGAILLVIIHCIIRDHFYFVTRIDRNPFQIRNPFDAMKAEFNREKFRVSVI